MRVVEGNACLFARQAQAFKERNGFISRKRQRFFIDYRECLLGTHPPERCWWHRPTGDEHMNIRRQQWEETSEDWHQPFGIANQMHVFNNYQQGVAWLSLQFVNKGLGRQGMLGATGAMNQPDRALAAESTSLPPYAGNQILEED